MVTVPPTETTSYQHSNSVSRLEAIASRLKAIASGFKKQTLFLEMQLAGLHTVPPPKETKK